MENNKALSKFKYDLFKVQQWRGLMSTYRMSFSLASYEKILYNLDREEERIKKLIKDLEGGSHE